MQIDAPIRGVFVSRVEIRNTNFTYVPNNVRYVRCNWDVIMNNLIVGPQCSPRGVASDGARRPRPQIFEFYSQPARKFTRQASPNTTNRNYSQPYVGRWFVPTHRYAYQRTVNRRQDSIFAHYSATFSHPPLFRMGRIHSVVP